VPGNGSDNPPPKPIGKMVVDLETLSLEQLNHIWSISGGVHYPALFYKVRLLKLEQDEPAEGEPIRTISMTEHAYTSSSDMKKSLKQKLKERSTQQHDNGA
jgi:hypothetical protein